MALKVQWVSSIATHAEAWRLLDLSGMTRCVRTSRNFTRAGFLYVNGNLVQSLKFRVAIGSTTLLELRFPNGRVISQEIMPINRPSGRSRPRSNVPTYINRVP